MDVNKCIFSGRLCEDPEVKDIGDGKKLARFRLAVECYKKEDKKVNFLKFVTWNCANFAEKNLKRGMKVLVESTCNSGSYLNGSGSKVYTTEFKANPSNSLPFGNVADIPEEFKRYQDRPNNPGPDDYNFKANPSLEINDLPPWECP